MFDGVYGCWVLLLCFGALWVLGFVSGLFDLCSCALV